VSTIGASGGATGSGEAVTALPVSVGAGAVPTSLATGVGAVSTGVVASEGPLVVPEPGPVLVVSIGLEVGALSVGLELVVPPDPVSTVLSTAPEVVGVVVAATVLSTAPEVVGVVVVAATALSTLPEVVGVAVPVTLEVAPVPTVLEVLLVSVTLLPGSMTAVETPAYAFGMRTSEVASAATMIAIRRREKRQLSF
jgi:hypothetical protein